MSNGFKIGRNKWHILRRRVRADAHACAVFEAKRRVHGQANWGDLLHPESKGIVFFGKSMFSDPDVLSSFALFVIAQSLKPLILGGDLG